MKKLITIAFGIFTFALIAASANAFEMGACHGEIQKYCHGVQVGENRIKECLKKNIAKLSDGCKANLLDAAIEKRKMDK